MKAVAASAAAQKIDALSTLVLDAAELANRSATTSTAAGQKLMETRAELEAELAKARRNGKIVLGVAGGVTITRIAKERCIAVRRPAYRKAPATAKPVQLAATGTLSTNEA